MKPIRKQWFTHVVSALLLLIMAIFSVTSMNQIVAAAHPNNENLPLPIDLSISPPVTSFLPLYSKLNPIPEQVQEQAAELLTLPEIEPTEQIPQVTISTYEITAYYLNVREQSNPDSNILEVLKQGTLVQVLSTTANGWLQLKDGGYVKASYTKLVSEEAILAVTEQPSLEQAVVPIGEDLMALNNIDNIEPLSPTSIVESESGLSEVHIEELLEGTDLEDLGLAEAILEIEQDYGINAYFTIAVMKLESGNGKSKLAKKKNNLFGLNAISGDAYNKGLSFNTKEDCIRKFGQLIADKYVEKGYTTVEKIAKKYCPANSKWPVHVKAIMERDYKKL
ncbi:MAG: glucosaminidase domain-containing protein [Candidatus Cohnella colombiensis]|uniref:Glucosaminidase domain-containing protein n=1 Tax=Candidatus Cohnella colombiensis TaxID=3121368 RepID=A0AA95F6H9_9BACL|nr:MAG: glucosaminidase domain-containing protein [Cohnella sp.]